MASPDTRRVRPSAAVMLVRNRGEALETFWVKRGDAVAYMPGFRAFIGGTVNPEDEALTIAGARDAAHGVLLACAIREAFEEAGVLVGVRQPGTRAALAAARTRLLSGDATFPELAWEHGWKFSAPALEAAGEWVSPAFAPTRFETSFFLARMPEGQEATVHPGELASGEWVRPLMALDRWRHGHETFAAPVLWSLIAMAEGDADLATRLAHGPTRAGVPVRRIELKWGIVLHPMKTRPLPPATHTNAYLVGESEMALIDPGSGEPEELESLFALIAALESEGRHVRSILLTHHHPDHIAGLEAVRARYPVPVAAHADTAQHAHVDVVLGDGDWIPLVPGIGDWTLRVIHTPGHTRGHLSFLHPRTKSLFTGDHIPGGKGTVIIDPPDGDMADYLRSLERLLAEEVETIFPGHGSPQGAAERRIRGLIAHRLEREGKVLSALADVGAPAELGALVERAYADTPRELWPYAERSLLAHLLKLEGEGRATREGERWRVS